MKWWPRPTASRRKKVEFMPDITQDSILKGRVLISQYKEGYRMAVDTVLLAASVRGGRGKKALDLGCGVGGQTSCDG